MVNDNSTTPNEDVLREHYGNWGEHPTYGLTDWQYEVANNDTRRGYWEWVASKLEQHPHDVA